MDLAMEVCPPKMRMYHWIFATLWMFWKLMCFNHQNWVTKIGSSSSSSHRMSCPCPVSPCSESEIFSAQPARPCWGPRQKAAADWFLIFDVFFSGNATFVVEKWFLHIFTVKMQLVINHHQPSSTIINHHQPSSTICFFLLVSSMLILLSLECAEVAKPHSWQDFMWRA